MSLHLDPRRRAMLAEMHVRVWSPLPADEGATQAGHAASPAVTVDAVTPAPAVTASAAHPASAPVKEVPVRTTAALSQAAPAAAVPAPAEPVLVPRPAGIEVMDWGTLHHTVTQCQACTLCTSRHHTVFGVGAAAAEGRAPQVDWMIVGEAPGENEDLQGEPFVGAAGKLLDNMLQAMGLSRSGDAQRPGVYITNVLKCRPPGNRNPQPSEVAQCLPYLERQVALLQPKLILAMGRFAVQALLQDSVPGVDTIPLGKLRGQVHAYRGLPVVVTYHPAYVLRNLPEKAKVWADLCLAMAQLQSQ